MDRRDFFKRLLIPTLLAPALASFRTGGEGAELFLISGEPQLYLPTILEELRFYGLIRSRTWTLSQLHPQADELKKALSGWKLVSAAGQSEIRLSCRSLETPARPSFVLIRDGRVVDLRLRYPGLWQDLQASTPTDELTVASLAQSKPWRASGDFVRVSIGGREIDRISLGRKLIRTYETGQGEVTVRVEQGRARVEKSSCRHQVCVNSKPISWAGERIICAPNHLWLEIEGRRSWDTILG